MSLTLIAVEVFGQEFTVAMAKDRKVPLQMKQTANERKNFSQYIENVRIKRMRVDHHKTAANSCACRETRSKVTAYLTKKAIFTNFKAVLFEPSSYML